MRAWHACRRRAFRSNPDVTRARLRRRNRQALEELQRVVQEEPEVDVRVPHIAEKAEAEVAAPAREAQQTGKPLSVHLQDASGVKHAFIVRPGTAFGTVFDAFAAKLERPRASFCFSFDGTAVQAADTPSSLGAEDGDVIDVKTV